MASDLKPWMRQLALCSEWLEIIARELSLRSHELDAEESFKISTYASGIQFRAQGLFDSLEGIALARERLTNLARQCGIKLITAAEMAEIRRDRNREAA